ncbi:phage tail tube protein [Methylobacterium sp. E-045]|uniref:phage tail tube protein n=1 Tax=Methylobacterium sp. E-045 TaxID=2836575 RepID=UPI001FB8B870|nr:phage tail tube protein [Methylobacterium sp. E-045]MCJ2132451.1 phage tail protein [Methylobacterium sp. E-045]
MTSPNLLPGNRFRANRGNGATPEVFTFLCIAQTKTITFTNEFEDATVADCDKPLSVPSRKSVLRSTAWGGSIAGIVDAKRFAVLETDRKSETPINYQFIFDKPAADGGGTYTGPIFIESLQVTSTNNGMVNFTMQFRGDGEVVWAVAA